MTDARCPMHDDGSDTRGCTPQVSSHRRIGPIESQVPPPISASPADGAWLNEPDIPFWKPNWLDSLRYAGGWGWLLLSAAMIAAVLAVMLLLPRFGWAILWMGEAKVVIFAVAIAISAAGYAVRRTVQGRRDPFCIHCGYTLRGLPDHHNCPECGRPFSLRLIDEYRRDPDWFIARCRAHRLQMPGPTTPFHAGPVRSKRSRDGT
jgi:hypothetical protein